MQNYEICISVFRVDIDFQIFVLRRLQYNACPGPNSKPNRTELTDYRLIPIPDCLLPTENETRNILYGQDQVRPGTR